MLDAIQGPLWVSAQATGRIRNYQLMMSLIILSNLPISFCILKLFPVAELVLVVKVLVNIVVLIARVLYLRKIYSFPVIRYIKKVVVPCLFISITSILLPYYVYIIIDGFWQLVGVVLTSILSVIVSVFVIGLSRNERVVTKNMIMKYLHRK